jgi:chromosome segregation ATPase
MAIDVMSMLRGRRQARAVGIEDLAQRLAKGEAIPPEEIEVILERTGCTDRDLQDRIDALERRAELLARVSAGNKAQARIDKIDADIGKAFEAVADAQRKHQAVCAKHADELFTLRQAVDAGSSAEDNLLQPENLSAADRERLAAARATWQEAEQAVSERRRSIPELVAGLEHAERELVDAVEQWKSRRNDPDFIDRKARAENAVQARQARLAQCRADLPALEQARAKAEQTVLALEEELRC